VKRILILGLCATTLNACNTTGVNNGMMQGVRNEGGGIYSISEMSTFGLNVNIKQAVKQCESEGKKIEIISQGQKTGMASGRQYNQLIFKCI
tara:strand:+ start:334 stop:609 length:276 start_codon:yes stop_codon:yes gene_type:complete